VHEIGAFCSATTKEMGLICEIGGLFSLVHDLVLVSSSTASLPPIYTYLQFSQVTGTDIEFLNNHNF
jgi:hypothetical protein